MSAKEDRINPCLFRDEQNRPISFCMIPCEQRQALQPLIERGGGIISSKQKPHSIRLLPPKVQARNDECISYRYITDCVELNKLLDMSKYKVKTGKQAEEIQKFFVKPHIFSRSHKNYSRNEDQKIIQYVLDKKRYLRHLSGNVVWKNLEAMKLMDRTWQSMRDRYLRHILPNIDNYQISEEKKLLLKGQHIYREVAVEADEFDGDVEPDDDEMSITESDADELDRQLLRQAEETRRTVQGERSTASPTLSPPVAKRSKSTRSSRRLLVDDDPSTDDCDLQLLMYAEAARQKVFSGQSSEGSTAAEERSAVIDLLDMHKSTRNATTARGQSSHVTNIRTNRNPREKSRDELLPVNEITVLDKRGSSERITQTSLTRGSSKRTSSSQDCGALGDELQQCEPDVAVTSNKPKPLIAKTSQLRSNGTVSLIGFERVVSSKGSRGKISSTTSVDGNGASCSMSWHSVNTHNSPSNTRAVTITDYPADSDSSPIQTHLMITRTVAGDSSAESTRALNKTAKLTKAFAGKNRIDGSKVADESLSNKNVNASTEQLIDSASVAQTVLPATFSTTGASAVPEGSMSSELYSTPGNKKGDDRRSVQSLVNFVMEETSDSEASSQQQPTSDIELPTTHDILLRNYAELTNKCKKLQDVAKWLGLPPVHFLQVLCMTNGSVDDAIYWVQNGSLPSGKPIWKPIEDDRKLMNADNDTYMELVNKYGSDAVDQRIKFLSFRM